MGQKTKIEYLDVEDGWYFYQLPSWDVWRIAKVETIEGRGKYIRYTGNFASLLKNLQPDAILRPVAIGMRVFIEGQGDCDGTEN